MALLRAQQGEQKAYEGGLACSCLAEYGGAGAGGEVEGQIVDDVAPIVGVGIAHAVEPYAARTVYVDGVALFFHGVFFQFHESLGGGEHAHKCGHEFGEAARGTLYFVYQL